MVCAVCLGKIRKGRKAASKRMKVNHSQFIHTKCLDAWRVRERLKGLPIIPEPPPLSQDQIDALAYAKHVYTKGRQFGMSTLQKKIYERMGGYQP